MPKFTIGQHVAFNTVWHGVPAGTACRVTRHWDARTLYGDAFSVERLDGEKLPSLSGPSSSTIVAPEYLTAI